MPPISSWPHDEVRQRPRGEDPPVRLPEEAIAGEDIVIARAGTPLVRLVPIVREPRPADVLEGVWPDLDPDDPFFESLAEDELAAWNR